MKFANYELSSYGMQYIGDYMQILAIDNLYQGMGILSSEIIYIPVDELKTYDGEYVVLPVTLPLVYYEQGGICSIFSDHIIPVFLGLTMVKEDLDEKEIDYLKKYSPVGCRDEATLNTLRRYGVPSFLMGCITVSFPERKNKPNSSKIYIVDVDSGVQECIPLEIRSNAIYRSHLNCDINLYGDGDAKSAARNIYQEYCRNAEAVITSLLHCAIPCLAAGIPTLLLRENVSYRFAWVEKILPIYTYDDVRMICWDKDKWTNGISQQWKKTIRNVAEEMISEAFRQNQHHYDISWFYENRKKKSYINDAVEKAREYIDKNWKDKNASYNYSIWGLTQMSEWIYNYIEKNYFNARLCHVYDAFRRIQFMGLSAEHPNNIKHNPGEIVFVTSGGATRAAKELLNGINETDYSFVMIYGDIIV